jgi:hypothetical protein
MSDFTKLLTAYREWTVDQLTAEVASLAALKNNIRQMQAGSIQSSGNVQLPDYNAVSEEHRAAVAALNEKTGTNQPYSRVYTSYCS